LVLPMVNLRCAKCGSDAGFLIETADGRALDVKGNLSTDRIKRDVHVTCTYCNNHWDHVPISVRDARLEDPFRRRVMH
jgi:DNA-directed RNA polymerase subunit RPC12/RpoP